MDKQVHGDILLISDVHCLILSTVLWKLVHMITYISTADVFAKRRREKESEVSSSAEFTSVPSRACSILTHLNSVCCRGIPAPGLCQVTLPRILSLLRLLLCFFCFCFFLSYFDVTTKWRAFPSCTPPASTPPPPSTIQRSMPAASGTSGFSTSLLTANGLCVCFSQSGVLLQGKVSPCWEAALVQRAD